MTHHRQRFNQRMKSSFLTASKVVKMLRSSVLLGVRLTHFLKEVSILGHPRGGRLCKEQEKGERHQSGR